MDIENYLINLNELDKKLFLSFVEKSSINEEYLNLMKIFSQNPFVNVKNDEKLRMLLIFYPEFWLFYLNDQDFLSFLENDWNDLVIVIQDFLNYEHSIEEKILDERLKNIFKLRDILKIFSLKYSNFPLPN
jgi:hypothetical protein